MEESAEEQVTDSSERPETSAELMPRKLYLVEVLLLPFFWLAPLLVLGLGGMMARDAGELNKKYGVRLDDLRYLLYFTPFVIGHFGSFGYRGFRRQQVLKSRDLETSAASRYLKEEYNAKNYVLFGWFLLQIVLFIVLVALPSSAVTLIDVTAMTTVIVFALNIVVGPVLVWWDVRKLRRVDSVEWGCTRYLHILAGALPFGLLVYLAQRIEHLYYAMLVDVWETPSEELMIADAEKTRIERFADWTDSLL